MALEGDPDAPQGVFSPDESEGERGFSAGDGEGLADEDVPVVCVPFEGCAGLVEPCGGAAEGTTPEAGVAEPEGEVDVFTWALGGDDVPRPAFAGIVAVVVHALTAALTADVLDSDCERDGAGLGGGPLGVLGVVQVTGEEHVAECELTVGADGEADGEAGGPVSAGDIATAFEIEAERAGAVDEAGGGDHSEGGEAVRDGGGVGEGTGAAGLSVPGEGGSVAGETTESAELRVLAGASELVLGEGDWKSAEEETERQEGAHVCPVSLVGSWQGCGLGRIGAGRLTVIPVRGMI